MIADDVDFVPWAQRLAAHGRVQIPGFLQPAAAEALEAELSARVPWQLAERSEGEPRTSGRGPCPDDAALAAILARSHARAAAGDYQFAYDSYMLVRAAREGWDPGLLVHRLLPFFNSGQCLGFIRALTGDAGLHRMVAQCTRYRPGQFLMPHNDMEAAQGRRYAFVINLSRDWRPDWGGQLQFLDEDGAIVETFLPRWNSLSLFRVPQTHQVTPVAPWAARPRHAVTGWWLES